MKRLLLVLLLLACALPGTHPTPTPVPSAVDLLGRLIAAGLEVKKTGPVGDFPPGGVDGSKFYTPSLCDGCSSLILIFDSEASALQAIAFFDQAAQTSEAFNFHIYRNGRVVLRMGGLIDESNARRYAEALGLD
jgi:hypothetical protein